MFWGNTDKPHSFSQLGLGFCSWTYMIVNGFWVRPPGATWCPICWRRSRIRYSNGQKLFLGTLEVVILTWTLCKVTPHICLCPGPWRNWACKFCTTPLFGATDVPKFGIRVQPIQSHAAEIWIAARQFCSLQTDHPVIILSLVGHLIFCNLFVHTGNR